MTINMKSMDAAMIRGGGKGALFPPLGSSEHGGAGGNAFLSAALAAARRASAPAAPPSETEIRPGLSNEAYVTLLELQRRDSMPDLNSIKSDAHAIAAVPFNGSLGALPVGHRAYSTDFAALPLPKETPTAPSRRRKPNFAEKLHSVLSDRDCRNAITWLPSGQSFCITDQHDFVKRVLPRYFREAKFESFSRRLKRWGFRKAYATGLSQIVFSHDLFHRDRPDLCRVMNGREKAAQGKNMHMANQNQTLALAGALSPQTQNQALSAQAQAQLREALLMRMAQQRQHTSQLQLQATSAMPFAAVQSGSHPSPSPLQSSVHRVGSLLSLRDSSPESTEAHTVLNKSMVPSIQSQVKIPSDSTIEICQAKIQLGRLSDDIAQCEEQLAILRRLRELKEARSRLAETRGPCKIPSSSA